MSTDQEERNKQTYHHFHDAITRAASMHVPGTRC
jgi:hypothetical protein